MEWTYTIVKSFSVNRHSLYGDRPSQFSLDLHLGNAELTFNPGEIDEPLYSALVKGYPDYVKRTPKNALVAAVYAARGMG